MTIDVAFVYLILFGGHVWLLRRCVFKDLPPAGVPLLIVLYALHFMMIALFYASRTWGSAWSWYFDYRFGEHNPAASYAAVLYLLVGLAAVAVALWGQPRRLWHVLYWLGVAAFFVYLGLDEYFALHEGAKNWSLIYGSAAGLMVLASGAVWWGLRRRERRVFVMLIGGLGVAAVGGVGLEMLALWDCLGYLGETCGRLPLIEEALENVGILTALLGVLLYAGRALPAGVWIRAQRGLLTGGVGCGLLLVTAPWFVPQLENRLIGQPAAIDYLDGRLSVVGYRLSHRVLAPDEALDLNVYWRTNQTIYGTYGFSVQLMDRTDGRSYAAQNLVIEEPRHDQALPGVVYRTRMSLKVPHDIPAQASYWLTLTTWRDKRPDFIPQPVSYTDRRLVTPDMAVLQSLPVVGQTPPPATEHPLDFVFRPDIALKGYSVKLEDHRLSLLFDWQTQSVIDRDYVQFLHLFDSSGGWVYGFDQPPMTERFPTIDWPPGMSARASWLLDLPPDLPPGDYVLRTGMYDAVTLDRCDILNSAGERLTDGIIELGTIRLGL